MEYDPISKEIQETFPAFTDFHELIHKDSGSRARFWRCTHTATGEACFMKCSKANLAKGIINGIQNAERLAKIIDEKGLTHFDIIRPLEYRLLSDGKIVVVTKFMEVETLKYVALRTKRFDKDTSRQIRDGLMECAEAFRGSLLYHRDLCPRNLMLSEGKLYLFDLDGMVYKEHAPIHNPSVLTLKLIAGASIRFYPRRGEWNEVEAVKCIYKFYAKKLDIDGKKEDLATLRAWASQEPTLVHHYVVDDAWRKAMKWEYLKLVLRPLWTCKHNTRQKRGYARRIIGELLRSPRTK